MGVAGGWGDPDRPLAKEPKGSGYRQNEKWWTLSDYFFSKFAVFHWNHAAPEFAFYR